MVLRALVVGVLVSALPSLVMAQAKPGPIEGVWRVAEVQTTGGPNPGHNTSPQPGYYIFTRGHYSVMTINASTARQNLPFQGPATSDAEKIARHDHWENFTANAGTYEVKGSTLTTRPLIAKNQGVIGTTQTREFKIEGTTLWLIQRPAAGGKGPETRTRLTRVE
jgi:hypothetical protein